MSPLATTRTHMRDALNQPNSSFSRSGYNLVNTSGMMIVVWCAEEIEYLDWEQPDQQLRILKMNIVRMARILEFFDDHVVVGTTSFIENLHGSKVPYGMVRGLQGFWQEH